MIAPLPPTSSKRRASVVIVTYGRNEMLVDSVRSVIAVLSADDELIVVDQVPNHDEATTAFLEAVSTHPQVRFIVMDAPSMTGARNVGAAAALGDILVYVDDDVLVSPGFVDGHLTHYLRPEVGAVAGGIEDEHGRAYSFGSGPYSTKLVGANMSFRRQVLFDIGGFDTNLFSTIRDDGDCGERVRRAGWRIGNGESSCRLVHRAAVGGAGARNRTDEWYRKSYHNCMYVFLKKPWYVQPFAFPRYLLGCVKNWNPGLRRFLSPSFFLGVFVRGHVDGIRTRLQAPRAPFLLSAPLR